MKATQSNDSTAIESTDLDDRDVRALTQIHTVLPEVPGLFQVVSQSGSAYTVDTREERCTCPDHKHRGVKCKHIRRAEYATGERPIPAWADRSAIDEHLGRHVDGVARVAATDGGVIATDDDAETSAGTDRPDDCQCWDAEQELPCWPCYRDGFRSPNPEEPGSDE